MYTTGLWMCGCVIEVCACVIKCKIMIIDYMTLTWIQRQPQDAIGKHRLYDDIQHKFLKCV